MAEVDRATRYKLAQEKARKVRLILAENKITFGEGIAFASEMFQILSVMGEVNPMLTKTLAYLAVKLQDSELANELLRQPNMPDSSREASEDSDGNAG